MVHLQNNLLLELCQNNPEKLNRANEIGRKCIETRMKLWDGVLEEIKERNL